MASVRRARSCLSLFFLLFATAADAAVDIPGVVRDASGAGITNAEVILMTPELTVVATARTATDGSFTLAAPAPGSYLVIARAPSFGEKRET